MKLHDASALNVGGQDLCELSRQVGFAGAGRAVQNHLPLVVQQLDNLAKECRVHKQLIGQFLERISGRVGLVLGSFVDACVEPVAKAIHPPRVGGEVSVQTPVDRAVRGDLDFAAGSVRFLQVEEFEHMDLAHSSLRRKDRDPLIRVRER